MTGKTLSPMDYAWKNHACRIMVDIYVHFSNFAETIIDNYSIQLTLGRL